jgi:chromosome segregation ATPase
VSSIANSRTGKGLCSLRSDPLLPPPLPSPFPPQVAAHNSSREADIKERVKREVVMEIDSVKQKLREEASRERAEIKRASDDSLRQERLKSDAQLESLHRSVAKTEEDCQTLRREVEALRVRVFSRQSELSDVQCELDEVTKRLRLVGIGGERSQDSGEALFDFETTLEGALLSKRESLESWVAELREAVERERERKDSSRAEFQDRVRERRAGMAVGISLPSSAPPLTSLCLSLRRVRSLA